jgi:hypothetical protein
VSYLNAHVSKLLLCGGNHSLRVKSHSACGKRTLRVEINLLRVKITLERVVITFVRIVMTLVSAILTLIRNKITLCV